MGTVDYENRNRFERRIGRRVRIDPLEVVWVVPRPGRMRRNRPPLEVPGHIDNISITGAAIVGPVELDLEPGTVAVVRLDGRESSVVVRHRSPVDDGTAVRVGVELPRNESPLKARILQLLDPILAPPPAPRPEVGPLLGVRPGDERADAGLGLPAETPSMPSPEPSSPPEPVIDLTDAAIAAHGEPVIELRDPAAALAEALRALDPLLVDLSATDAGATAETTPAPRRASELGSSAADGTDEVEPPSTGEAGRQLDDAFRLMDD